MRRIQEKVFLLIFLIGVIATLASDIDANEPQIDPKWSKYNLTSCIDVNLGYKITCSPFWDLDTKPDGISLVLNDTPGQTVSVKISKWKETGVRMEDLTGPTLQYVFDYADFFIMGKTKIGDKPAVWVKAHHYDHPNTQLLDYFLINQTLLYRISFSVNTKEKFLNYEPLFDKLIESVDFFDANKVALSFKDSENPAETTP